MTDPNLDRSRFNPEVSDDGTLGVRGRVVSVGPWLPRPVEPVGAAKPGRRLTYGQRLFLWWVVVLGWVGLTLMLAAWLDGQV